MKEGLAKYADSVDPRKLLALSREYVKEAVREKIRLFQSAGVIDASVVACAAHPNSFAPQNSEQRSSLDNPPYLKSLLQTRGIHRRKKQCA